MDSRDTHIDAVAASLLVDVGETFTMEQLAARAHIPRATLYRRVGSKQALLARLAAALKVSRDTTPPPRTRVLLAARRVVARAGLAGATMEQIAAEAGVGVATVYRHFGDKEHLITAFIAELSPRSCVRDLAAPTGDVGADLQELARALLPFFYEYRDILRLIWTDDPHERAYIETLRAGSDRTVDQLAAYFATQISTGHIVAAAEPHALALAFLGLLLAFTLIGPTHYATPLTDAERTAALIAQLFVSGVVNTAPSTAEPGMPSA